MSGPATLRESTFRGRPCLRLERGLLEAVLLPSLGGRVIALRIDGLDVFWHDERVALDDEARAREPGPVFWGGWKTWIAPQAAWPEGRPPRALDEGTYAQEVAVAPTGSPLVRLASPVCPETGLRVRRDVSIEADRLALRVHVTLENAAGKAPVEAGIWEVLQLQKPFAASFPVDRGHFPDERGVRTYVHEGVSREARERHVRLLDDAAGRKCEIRCSGPHRWKFGARTPANLGKLRAAMPERGKRTLRLLFDAPQGARYAHDGANVEVYSSDGLGYAEIEAHAPLATLAPGESTQHTFLLEVTPPPPVKIRRREPEPE